jgi:hypothetical protein
VYGQKQIPGLAWGRIVALLCFLIAMVLGVAAWASKSDNMLDLVCWAIFAGAAGGAFLAGST